MQNVLSEAIKGIQAMLGKLNPAQKAELGSTFALIDNMAKLARLAL